MFGKRTTFGGNTPGAVQAAPRPAAQPVVPAARADVTRAADSGKRDPSQRTDENGFH